MDLQELAELLWTMEKLCILFWRVRGLSIKFANSKESSSTNGYEFRINDWNDMKYYLQFSWDPKPNPNVNHTPHKWMSPKPDFASVVILAEPLVIGSDNVNPSPPVSKNTSPQPFTLIIHKIPEKPYSNIPKWLHFNDSHFSSHLLSSWQRCSFHIFNSQSLRYHLSSPLAVPS